jgi:hypothetical protein
VVEDLKKMKENIYVMDLCRIPQQKDLLLQALKEDEKTYDKSKSKSKHW